MLVSAWALDFYLVHRMLTRSHAALRLAADFQVILQKPMWYEETWKTPTQPSPPVVP